MADELNQSDTDCWSWADRVQTGVLVSLALAVLAGVIYLSIF